MPFVAGLSVVLPWYSAAGRVGAWSAAGCVECGRAWSLVLGV